MGFSTDLLNYSLIFARWAHWFLNLIRGTNVDKTYLFRVLKVPKSIFKFSVYYNRGLKVCVKKFILGEREEIFENNNASNFSEALIKN